jgi:hypothetical protein
MRKIALLIAALLLLSGTYYGQTMIKYDGLKLSDYESQQCSQINSDSYTRGKGFVIRPELYRGFFCSFGYQFNPYVQSYLSAGYGDGLTAAVGARVYTNKNKWTGMIDTRFCLADFDNYGISVVGGASYKDLDFGLGFTFYFDPYFGGCATAFVFAASIGWNIRCYPHR